MNAATLNAPTKNNILISNDSKMRAQGETSSNNLKQENLVAFPLLFAEQLARTPDNTAIVFEDREYTYKELDDYSEQFKQAVLSHQSNSAASPQSETSNSNCIGICIDKSPEAIAAMLGILKSGAAFVPLDPEYPAERIAYMVADANLDIVLIQPNHQQNISPFVDKELEKEKKAPKKEVKWINCYQPLSNKVTPVDRDVVIQPSDLAYIMYTSGSTGKPKGVQIEHAALATYCYADIDVYKVQESDRTLQFSTINFDIAIEEIFPPLITGSCIVIRPSERSDQLNELSSIINDYKVTAVHIATAYWHEWVDLMIASEDHIPKSLRLMVVTGEKISTKHYQRWKQLFEKPDKQANAKNILWCNAYGPTEATVSASVFIPAENFAEDNMPIGIPLKRYTAMIVDEKYNNLPAGETGQLLIGGPALARGYLNRPELNEEVFVDVSSNSSNTSNEIKKSQRMYKTGDLARWLPDGNIEFAGRIDHQIKLGSYRIEPGEIEVAINQHEQVLESLITYEEVEGKKTLIAYVSVGNDAINNRSVTSYQIFGFLKENLPSFMVPARYVLLGHFPKTTNGKIDRIALPSASQSEVPRASTFAAPRNVLEQKLAKMWQEVLQLPEVSIYDDFFALGGSSLLAVGVVSRLISDLKLELPVRDFFANPTIASQAKHINNMLGFSSAGNNDDEADQIDNDSKELRKRLPKVSPVFFKSGDNNLYGVHYQPQNNQPSHSHAVLMCHPLGHEYPRSYRNLQQFSIQLGQAGFDTFRFDYAGTGNSSGESSKLTAEQCISDIQAAASYIKEQSQCEHFSIIATRMGAPLLMKALNSIQMDSGQNIDNIILWDPVVHGRNYLQLLEKFHHKSLTNLERFRQIRKPSNLKQLYGHAMSNENYDGLAKLSMPIGETSNVEENLSTANKILITSTNYVPSEPDCEQLASDWQHFYTKDNIYWHDIKYTDSAFSSPQAFQIMMTTLNGGRS